MNALPTAGRFPVRRKRPNRPSVDNASRRSWCPRQGVQFNLGLWPESSQIMHATCSTL